MGLTKTGYRKRIIDTQIENNLQAFGAVCMHKYLGSMVYDYLLQMLLPIAI